MEDNIQLVQAPGRPGANLLWIWGASQIHGISQRFSDNSLRILYWTGNGIVVEPVNGSNPGLDLNENLSFPDNIYFSAMVFTAKTQVKWYPVGICRYLATAESILGWLLLALFLATLGRTMIR